MPDPRGDRLPAPESADIAGIAFAIGGALRGLPIENLYPASERIYTAQELVASIALGSEAGVLDEAWDHLIEAGRRLAAAGHALQGADKALTQYLNDLRIGVGQPTHDLILQKVPRLVPHPNPGHQSRFFKDTFRNACLKPTDEAGYSGKAMGGPFMDEIRAIWALVDEGLNNINPELTSDYLLPRYERPREFFACFSKTDQIALEALRARRLAQMKKLAEQKVWPVLEQQIIEAGLLTTPPYFQQGDNGDPRAPEARIGCMNACFRMVFGGITGWTPDEMAVSQGITYGNKLPADPPGIVRVKTSDTHFLQVFHTAVFQERFPGRATTRQIVGADFATIARYAQTIRAKVPGAQVYCIAKVGTEVDRDNPDKAHAVILLGSDAEHVYCHDPSQYKGVGEANRPVAKKEFVRRWAVGYNVALLIVHLP